MTLTERRAHWRAAHKDPELLKRQREFDPSEALHQCFTTSHDAAEWMIEQLAERTVVALGGFEAAADAAAWLHAQGSRDKEGTPEQISASGDWRVISADFGGIEYRMEVCSCLNEVTGRCHNLGCDKDTDWDSEPDGGRYPSYTKWGTYCSRCWYPEWADGGRTGSDAKPLPQHRHSSDVRTRVRRLIEGDEWTGWRCVGEEHGEGCEQVWRFADAEEWKCRYRLTRKWNGKVTGTEGYMRTEEEAAREAEYRTRESLLYDRGYTVGFEKIDKEHS